MTKDARKTPAMTAAPLAFPLQAERAAIRKLSGNLAMRALNLEIRVFLILTLPIRDI